MGRELHAASPAARAVFEAVDDALGEHFSRLMFEGPEADLVLTANAQPAILTCSIAALEALRERAPGLGAPAVAAGHSLGEYSALVAAGALTLTDAVRVVRARGEAMQRAVPPEVGTMAAFMGGSPAIVAAACEQACREVSGQVVSPANFNAPGQIVVAGHRDAVARASELASAQGLKIIALKVSAPFHCQLMAPAAQELKAVLDGIPIARPQFRVLRNVDAKEHEADPKQIAAALVDQVCSAVRWEETMTWFSEHGVTSALEFGPGKVLAGLLRKGAKGVSVMAVSAPEEVEAAASSVA